MEPTCEQSSVLPPIKGEGPALHVGGGAGYFDGEEMEGFHDIGLEWTTFYEEMPVPKCSQEGWTQKFSELRSFSVRLHHRSTFETDHYDDLNLTALGGFALFGRKIPVDFLFGGTFVGERIKNLDRQPGEGSRSFVVGVDVIVGGRLYLGSDTEEGFFTNVDATVAGGLRLGVWAEERSLRETLRDRLQVGLQVGYRF